VKNGSYCDMLTVLVCSTVVQRPIQTRWAVVHDARPSLIIFAVLSAVLRSGFRDTVVVICASGLTIIVLELELDN